MENYFKTHNGYKDALKTKKSEFDGMYFQYKKDLEEFIPTFPKYRILEIWCGMGSFANFCNRVGVKQYTGIDIDDYFFVQCKKDFPDYEFIKVSFQEYIQKHKNEFDVIFTSHVFEHLDEKERNEMITMCYEGLKKGGRRINYMPNSNNFLYLGTVRYGDITHKTVYNDNSFSQLVYGTNLPFKIENKNIYVGCNSKIKRIIHLFFLSLTRIYCLGMGQNLPNIYTRQFINILEK